MHEFQYDYVKLKYGEKENLYYMGTDSLTAFIKTEDIQVDIEKDIETKFHTSKYELHWSLTRRKTKKIIGLVKDELMEKYCHSLFHQDQNQKAV